MSGALSPDKSGLWGEHAQKRLALNAEQCKKKKSLITSFLFNQEINLRGFPSYNMNPLNTI